MTSELSLINRSLMMPIGKCSDFILLFMNYSKLKASLAHFFTLKQENR